MSERVIENILDELAKKAESLKEDIRSLSDVKEAMEQLEKTEANIKRRLEAATVNLPSNAVDLWNKTNGLIWLTDPITIEDPDRARRNIQLQYEAYDLFFIRQPNEPPIECKLPWRKGTYRLLLIALPVDSENALLARVV